MKFAAEDVHQAHDLLGAMTFLTHLGRCEKDAIFGGMFKCIFIKERYGILIQILTKFVPCGPI